MGLRFVAVVMGANGFGQMQQVSFRCYLRHTIKWVGGYSKFEELLGTAEVPIKVGATNFELSICDFGGFIYKTLFR